MRTGKSISNIGYVRPEYFKQIANTLRKSGVIGTCYWIAHKGEDGDKDHIHLVLLGGQKTYNTQGLSSLFGWDMVEGQKGSLTERWQVTKSLNDWLCYAVHDTVYLLRRGLVRNTSYSWDEVQCTEGDEDLLRRDIIDAKRSITEGEDKVYRALRILASQGYTWNRVVLSGLIPVNCLGAAYPVFSLLLKQYHTTDAGMKGGSDDCAGDRS